MLEQTGRGKLQRSNQLLPHRGIVHHSDAELALSDAILDQHALHLRLQLAALVVENLPLREQPPQLPHLGGRLPDLGQHQLPTLSRSPQSQRQCPRIMAIRLVPRVADDAKPIRVDDDAASPSPLNPLRPPEAARSSSPTPPSPAAPVSLHSWRSPPWPDSVPHGHTSSRIDTAALPLCRSSP